jgi:hypothetical protein
LILCVAPPNPITDDESDESVEKRGYNYPLRQKAPYWNAFSPMLKKKLAIHDKMERSMRQIRDLDFKLREAWTPNDKPFNEQ